VIFLQLILNNFGDNYFSVFVIGQKQWGENKNIYEYEREGCFKSCQKVVVQISFLFI